MRLLIGESLLFMFFLQFQTHGICDPDRISRELNEQDISESKYVLCTDQDVLEGVGGF